MWIFSNHDKEFIQTHNESREKSDKEIEYVVTSSCYPPIKELKEKLSEIVNCEISNCNAEMSDLDKLRSQPQDVEYFRNISTMIRDLQKFTDNYFEVGDKMWLHFCKGNASRMDVDTKVGVNFLKIVMHTKEPNSNTFLLWLHWNNENYNVTKRIRRKKENEYSWGTYSSSCNCRWNSHGTKRKGTTIAVS